MTKKIKKERQVKELFDLEIDEVSAVDKPAIGEEFYITKSVNNKKGATVKKPIKKSVAWKQVISKGVSEDNTHCVFCGITKEEEAEQLGMGLIKSVCFECAIENDGVFDAIMNDTFDAESFQKENPDMELKLSLQKDEGEESDDEEESEEESSEEGKEKEEESDEEESEDEESDDEEESEEDKDEDEESESDEEGKEKSSETATEDGEQDEAGQESDEPSLEKKVETLEKSLEDVSTMLERSLELHDMAASALNEIVALTFGSLDGLMMMMEESMGEDEKAKELFSEIMESIKSEREACKNFSKKNGRFKGNF